MSKAKKITEYKEFIAYYGKQAAYWEQRLKELDMADTNQLPPHTITIRDHPEPHIMQWSDLELAAVKRYAEQYALQARTQVQSEPATVAVDHFDNGPFEAYTNRIYPSVEIGTKLYITPQPARSTQAEATDDVVRDAERYRYLRDIRRRDSIVLSGPEAGVWCDAEDEDGTLLLLTEDDLDAAIDDAMLAAKEGTNGEIN